MGRTIITEKDLERENGVQPSELSDITQYAESPPPAVRTLGIIINESKPHKKRAKGVYPPEVDKYSDKLLKYIPSEVIALYITYLSAIRAFASCPPWVHWASLGVGLVGTWLYLSRMEGVTKPLQIVISVIAFAIWVFALGGPFALLKWYNPLYPALLLPTFTFFIPFVKL